ncbi:MAG TPA: F0F1 ATP synthase subunit alpha [Candidatus Hydrogenedens sp.]|nr:F0F1 ATP synthase subunit alpha [Candidatus Hydrogenedens sp.]HOK08680.1 F0F1 ATP synthase subunit alpha [Candidatus Hydrogenedens sp.]HOL21011.1 F0F1 ATP synthase subunit alpha [Candidatus Hydrogenedens sp.]HPP58279.1 F0F1 ATP synthase subunit alpha [Candidatus Hydrogenedens sp.]
MSYNPRIDEITNLIKQQISSYSGSIEVSETGTVIQSGDGIARIFGLEDAFMGELIDLPHNVKGMVFNLEEDHIGAILLGDYETIKEGDLAKRTWRVASVPVGESLIGRVVNALGEPVDAGGPIQAVEHYPVERISPGIIERTPVNIPLLTGIKAIDSMVPIGRGQRELIIGDRQTGKTSLAIDTIINQSDKNVICIYVAIGQKRSTVAQIVNDLTNFGAMKYTIIVSATASEPAPMQYLAPFAGCAMGEYFRDKGEHVLIIYDDLSKHASAYRQISLLLRRPPGREAYPGDIFYLHSRLLERSACLHPSKGGGTLTALPIVETQEGDVSSYIPTNVISITDGQIYLDSPLFYSGIRPAINPGISVSRVGGSAQTPIMKKIAGTLRILMAQYRELEVFSQFGSELDESSKAQLERGKRLTKILTQDRFKPCGLSEQIIIIFAGIYGFTDKIPLNDLTRFETELTAYIKNSHPDLYVYLGSNSKWDDTKHKELEDTIQLFLEKHWHDK